jgi:MFS family permease
VSGAPSQSLGRRFRWLWAAYAVSAYGSGFGLGAFSLIAVLALHAGPTEVSLLAASGLAVGAVMAVPTGPWVEFRRKRPVMVAMDLTRFAALASVPVAYACGRLGLAQLVIVAVLTATAKIAFNAASGAYLKGLVHPEDLLVANGRFEATTWTATVLGPPLGGAAIGLFGPVITMLADSVSYLLSALGILAIGGGEADASQRRGSARNRTGELVEGWRHILGHEQLRRLFANSLLVNGFIMAGEPLIAVLMLGRLGFAPWQYGLAFAAPCVGGLVGARLARRLVARFGRHRVLVVAGTLRACWPLGLAFVQPGVAGLVLVLVVQFGLVTCCGIFNPVLATYRLEQTPTDRVARTLSAWSVSSSAAIAVLTALWGVLAGVAGPRIALAAAGILLLATPMLLPRRGLAPGTAVPDQQRSVPAVREPSRS